jgi:hypothetical protein
VEISSSEGTVPVEGISLGGVASEKYKIYCEDTVVGDALRKL